MIGVVNPEENLIMTIYNKHAPAEYPSTIKDFKRLFIRFLSDPYFINKVGNRLEATDSPTENSLYGYGLIIDNNYYFISEKGLYHLEDENGFQVSNLSLLQQGNIEIQYDFELTVFSNESDAFNDDTIYHSSDYTSDSDAFDLIKQLRYEEKDLPQNTNLYITETGYDLVGVTIEADENTSFLIDSKEIIIGHNERINLFDNFSTFTYKGYYNSEGTLIPFTNEVLITYYFKEG
jgi:hypothetical protein